MTTTERDLVAPAPTTRVRGLVPPIPTPMKDGKVDRQSLHAILENLRGHVSGVLVGGSLGENASLTVDERIDLMREVATHADSQWSLAMSVSDNSIETTRRLCTEAIRAGARLLVASPPNYYSNDSDMLAAYFGALSDFAGTDLCLYDNPLASHTPLSVASISAIAAAAPTLTHIKVTDITIDKVELIRAGTSLTVHAGDDQVLWHQLMRGAEGAMVALPVVYPELAAKLWHAVEAGDFAEARSHYDCVMPFIHLSLGAPDYVAVTKAILHHQGVISSPEVRLPLLQPSRRRHEEIIGSL